MIFCWISVVNYNNLAKIFLCFVTLLLPSKKFAWHFDNCENIETRVLSHHPLPSIFFFFFLIDGFLFLNFLNFLPCLFSPPPAAGILKILKFRFCQIFHAWKVSSTTVIWIISPTQPVRNLEFLRLSFIFFLMSYSSFKFAQNPFVLGNLLQQIVEASYVKTLLEL